MQKFSRYIRLRWPALLSALFCLVTHAAAFNDGDNVYLQFPAVGKVLYYDGTVVQAGNYDAAAVHQWTLVDDADGSTNTWKISNGTVFLKANDAGTGLEVTTETAEATVFTFASLTYLGLTPDRYEISCNSGKYLHVLENGTLTLSTNHCENNQNGYPYTILRLAQDLHGPQLPPLASDTYRYIYFPATGKYMKDMSGGHAAHSSSSNEAYQYYHNVEAVDFVSTEDDSYKWAVVQDGTNGYYLVSKYGNYLHIKNAPGPMAASTDDKGKHRLAEAADATDAVNGIPRYELWRLRRRVTEPGRAITRQSDNTFSETTTTDDSYFSFEQQAAEPCYISFPLTGNHVLRMDGETGTLSAPAWAEAEAVAYTWLLESTGTAGEYRLRALANHRYLKLNSTKDGYTSTADAAEALVLTKEANPYYHSTRGNRYRLAFEVDGNTRYLACSDDGVLTVSDVAASRYNTLRMEKDVRVQDKPVIAQQGQVSAAKWYQLKFTYQSGWNNQHSLRDGEVGGNAALGVFSVAEPEFYWQLVDAGAGNGDVLLKSYAGHQLTGGTSNGNLFTLAATDNTMALQENMDRSGYTQCWQLYINNGGMSISAFYENDYKATARPGDWEGPKFTFEETALPYPSAFCATLSEDLSMSIAFNGYGASDHYYLSTSSGTFAVEAAASDNGAWKLIGDAGDFVLYSVAESKYVVVDAGLSLSFTTEAAGATHFCLQPNNSAITDKFVWSIVLRDDATKALGLNATKDGLVVTDAISVATSLEFFPFLSDFRLIQFAANGRKLLTAGAVGETVTATTAGASDTYASLGNEVKWAINGTDNDFVLINKNNHCLAEELAADGSFIRFVVTTEISKAVHLRKVATDFVQKAGKEKDHQQRYDFCKVGDASKRLALTDEAGTLGWSTIEGTRYSTIRVAEELAGGAFPVVTPLVLTNANDERWYRLRFGYNNACMTSPENAGTTLPVSTATPGDAQLWRFEKVLSADGLDRGEFYLRDVEGRYLTYSSSLSRYTVTYSAASASRMRLVEDCDTTTINGYNGFDYWRLYRVGAHVNNCLHQPFGGAPEVGEYDATSPGNYFTLEEATLSYPDIFVNSSSAIAEDRLRVLRFATAGTAGLFADPAGTSVEAKNQEGSDEFRWAFIGTGDNFILSNPAGDRFLHWDGSALSTTDAEASATAFRLHRNLYEVRPTRWDVCLADGTAILSVNPATGAVTMAGYGGSTRLTTINITESISATPRELSTGGYLRIAFAANSHRLVSTKSLSIVSKGSVFIDNRNNIWQLIVHDAARGDYYLRNGNGLYVKGTGLTENVAEADVFCLVEGIAEEEKYWQLYLNGGSLTEDPSTFTVSNAEKTDAADLIFTVLSKEEAARAMYPMCSYSTTEGGAIVWDNTWYNINHVADSKVLRDGGGGLEATVADPVKQFTQLWRVTAASYDEYGIPASFRLESNAGNFLVRTESAEGVVTYLTSAKEAAATVFTLHPIWADDDSEISDWQISPQGTDKILSFTAGGKLAEVESTSTEPSTLWDFAAVSWYMDRMLHRVQHKRNGIYDKQGKPADATDSQGHKLGIDYATGLQSTNEYPQTIYIKKGQSVSLESPTRRTAAEFKHINYQRWFDYTTGGAPVNGVLALDQDWLGTQQVLAYRNGLVLGNAPTLTGGYTNGTARFTMPVNAGEVVSVGTGAEDYTVPADYSIAYEISRYTDVSGFDDPDANPTEASLQLRGLYSIHEAQQIADKLLAFEGTDAALEEYSITFPTRVHGSSKSTYAYEVLPIAMPQSCYFSWNTESTDYVANGLVMEIEDNDALGIGRPTDAQLATSLNSGLIAFTYPANGRLADGADGKSVTINVYTNPGDGNTVRKCHVARFVITFREEFDVKLYTDIIGHPEVSRSPESLNANFGLPVAALTFDQSENRPFIFPDGSLANNTNTYGIPLQWDDISYAYFPVSPKITGSGSNAAWGEYAVVRQFQHGFGSDNTADESYDRKPIFYDLTKTYYETYLTREATDPDLFHFYCDAGDPQSNYLLYVDSSEKPGEIASLPFEGGLCPGSKMYFSAWISSGNENLAASPASVIFDLVGVGTNAEGQPEENLIYSFCPGQITGRYRDGETVLQPETNKAGGGFWQQVYFYFSDNSGKAYTSYQLRLRNNCMNSAGGDILLDNVKVYISHPTIEVTQSAPVCGTAVNFLTVESDFDALLNTTGDTEAATGSGQQRAIWYCFLDKAKYEEVYAGNSANAAKAFSEALLGSPGSTAYGKGAFHKAYYKTAFADNRPFHFAEAREASSILTYRREVGGRRSLVFVDRIEDVKMEPGREYVIVMAADAGWSLGDFVRLGASLLDPKEKCGVTNTFTAAMAYSIRVNDDTSFRDGSVQVCRGASTTLRTELVGLGENASGESEEVVSHGVYHDWWLDFVGGAFNDQKTTTSGGEELYLSEAWAGFRAYNPKAETLDGAVLGNGADRAYAFTQEMLDYLRTFVEPADENHPAPLLLYRNSITVNVDLPDDENSSHVTVLPIPPGADDVSGVLYCYEPQQINIQITGSTPQAFIGLPGKTYPAVVDYVALRLGQEQVDALKSDAADAPELLLPFRRVKFANRDLAPTLEFSDRVTEGGNTYGKLLLAGTNDPRFDFDPDDLESDHNLYVVGRVTQFSVATSEVPEGGNLPASSTVRAKLRFNDTFQPREGYYYTLRFKFQEVYAGTQPDDPPCDGTAVTTLKIVPKYALWNGSQGDDWTNDENWQRADLTDLNPGGEALAADNPLAAYVTNSANGRASAYVPMYFTKALLPATASRQVHLQNLTAAAGEFLTPAATATPYIQYDMQLDAPTASEPDYTCSPLRTNVCDEVTIQDGARLLRSDLLTYRKAWTECRLLTGRWYTLATPLQDIYAGDWYVPSATGRQLSPYFQDISYNATADYNHRFRPAVYQRGWDKGAAVMYLALNTKNTTDVAIAADWSNVYNDVQQAYGAQGFSLKVEAPGMGYGEVLFRFPKADEKYQYYTSAGVTDTYEYPVSRTKSGRLQTDLLNTAEGLASLLDNHTDANPYYLVGNPFPCGMSMNEFFTANKDVFEPKFWIVTAAGQQTAIKNEANWTQLTADASGVITSDDIVLPPMQGFFVKRKAAAVDGSTSFHFNTAMMADTPGGADAASPLLLPRAAALPQGLLAIRAEAAAGATTCAVALRPQSVTGFAEGEDAECFVDPTLCGLPYVYTLADTLAASLNALPRLDCVPLGVQCAPTADGSTPAVRLTFSGSEGFDGDLYLLDRQTMEQWPIDEGFTLTLEGSTLGRYFILSDEASVPEEALVEPLIRVEGRTVSVYCPGTAVGDVGVYDMGGRRVLHHAGITASVHSFSLPAGVYTVAVRGESPITRKVVVR